MNIKSESWEKWVPIIFEGGKSLYYSFFGTISIFLLFHFSEKTFSYFFPFVSPRGITGFTFYVLHTVSLLLFWSLIGLFSLKTLSIVRLTWNFMTPPFEPRQQRSSSTPDEVILKKASRRGFSFLGAGIYVAFLMPFIGFVPYRYGYILLGSAVNADLPDSVPTILSEFPFINELAFIGGFIASPSLLGRVIIGISIALTVVGLWNVGYLCFHHDQVISWSREKQNLTEYFIRGMPHFGAAAFLLFLARQWPNWPIMQ